MKCSYEKEQEVIAGDITKFNYPLCGRKQTTKRRVTYNKQLQEENKQLKEDPDITHRKIEKLRCVISD